MGNQGVSSFKISAEMLPTKEMWYMPINLGGLSTLIGDEEYSSNSFDRGRGEFESLTSGGGGWGFDSYSIPTSPSPIRILIVFIGTIIYIYIYIYIGLVLALALTVALQSSPFIGLLELALHLFNLQPTHVSTPRNQMLLRDIFAQLIEYLASLPYFRQRSSGIVGNYYLKTYIYRK